MNNNNRRRSLRLRRLEEEREILQMLNSVPNIGNVNAGNQRINDVIGSGINRLSHRINAISINLTEYVNDAQNLQSFSDNELLALRNLLITTYNALSNELNRHGNDIEAIGYLNRIVTPAIRL
jgi:hypothetical protein